ncbi:mannosyltransferase putative-domain-containing protein [Pestalotiopsis sp. NC0098]|nr:mannosyltransferase putative-domain-containing protein [Pestalotiopsis sp. NC0098]
MADLFPFLSGESRGKPYTNLFDKLKTSSDTSSRGIVIPTSVDNLRQTFHLVGALREVLHTTLPIQIVYAGNDGLRSFQREMLAQRFTDIRFLDIYTVFREPSSQSDVSLSSLKTFACVATTFEEFILLSGDIVLLRKPEELFDLPTHRRTGAVIFNNHISSSGQLNEHDSSGFQPDTNAEVSQIHDLSVAVLDKSRHSVLFAMLHASWQCHLKEQSQTDHNAVNRESETWRLGFEHTSAPYELQTPTDALVGRPRFEAGEEICKFAHGFSGLNGRILWYSQPMPIVESPADQDIPTHRVAAVSGQHELSNNDIICAVRNEAQRLRSQEKQVIKEIIYKAQELDEEFKLAKMHRSLTSSNGEVYR